MDDLIVDKEYNISEVYGGKHRGTFVEKMELSNRNSLAFLIDNKREVFESNLIHWKLIV